MRLMFEEKKINLAYTSHWTMAQAILVIEYARRGS